MFQGRTRHTDPTPSSLAPDPVRTARVQVFRAADERFRWPCTGRGIRHFDASGPRSVVKMFYGRWCRSSGRRAPVMVPDAWLKFHLIGPVAAVSILGYCLARASSYHFYSVLFLFCPSVSFFFFFYIFVLYCFRSVFFSAWVFLPFIITFHYIALLLFYIFFDVWVFLSIFLPCFPTSLSCLVYCSIFYNNLFSL